MTGPGPAGLLPEPLRREVQRRYGLTLGAAVPMRGLGDEASLWCAQSSEGRVVVRVCPSWRTAEELAWVHDLLIFAGQGIPEAVVPLAAANGETCSFSWEEQQVALFPFVKGAPLERENPQLRDAAAGLLARLHRTLPAWPGRRPRPSSGPDGPATWTRFPDPPAIVDLALDAWHAGWLQSRAPALSSGPLHGDFSPRNLVCWDNRIAGLVDWDDARLDVYVNELAWATWEFAQIDNRGKLDFDRARAFLDAYGAGGGQVPDDIHEMLTPLIRWHMRKEVRQAFAAAVHGIPQTASDIAYTGGQLRTFEWLKTADFVWRNT